MGSSTVCGALELAYKGVVGGVVIADHTRVHRTTIYSELIPM